MNSEWWKLLEMYLDGEISEIQGRINQISKERNQLEYNENDVDRMEMWGYKLLKILPDVIIDSIDPVMEVDNSDLV